MAPEAQKQARRFSQLSTNKARFWHLPVLRWRYFIEWVWRGRDEQSRTVEKSEIGRGDQKLEETCFWDFHIPRQMAQRDWAPSFCESFFDPNVTMEIAIQTGGLGSTLRSILPSALAFLSKGAFADALRFCTVHPVAQNSQIRSENS